MSELLKPCPFCGGEAIRDKTPKYDEKTFSPNGEYYHSFTCINCGMMIEDFDTRQQATDAWNKRTEPEKIDVFQLGSVVNAITDAFEKGQQQAIKKVLGISE